MKDSYGVEVCPFCRGPLPCPHCRHPSEWVEEKKVEKPKADVSKAKTTNRKE